MNLFLDFDGVTHPITGDTFHSKCIEYIENALEGLCVQIVISSTWRDKYEIDELRELLGSKLGGLVVGVTPIIDDPFLKYIRYHEVLRYLSDNDQGSQPWLALDDTRGFYPNDAPVIWCNPRTGVTWDEAARLREVLTKFSTD